MIIALVTWGHHNKLYFEIQREFLGKDVYFPFAGFSASRKVKLVIKIYSLYSTENHLAIALVVSRWL